jgi:hypothetical protein
LPKIKDGNSICQIAGDALTMSTIEAELTALDTATVKAEWFRELLVDLPIVEKQIPAILIKLSRHEKNG